MKEALLESLVPGTSVQRHRRQWKMARFEHSGNYVTGRIGFVAPGSTEELWNEKEQDFEPKRLTVGSTSPFSILMQPQEGPFRVAFQLRGSRIKLHTFTTNLQALLNERAPGRTRWSVEPELNVERFEEWVDRVDKVVRLSITLEKPNPHYKRESVEEVVEGMKARMVFLQAQSDDGLDVNDAFIQDAIEHAGQYGKYSAAGEKKGKRLLYRSRQRGSAERKELPIDPDTGEVRPSDLKRAVKEDRDDKQ